MTGNTANAATQDKIIVSGASGQLGRLVVKGLLARGVPAKNLILVSRNTESAQDYAKQGAAVRFGDFEKPESLPAAFAGGTRMLLISVGYGGTPRPEPHGARSKRRKRRASNRLPTRRGSRSRKATRRASAPITPPPKRSAEEERRAVHLPAQLHLSGRAARPGRENDRRRQGDDRPANEMKLGYVTRADCAAAAVAVLTTPGHDNKAYDITGPELLGQAEIAAAAPP